MNVNIDPDTCNGCAVCVKACSDVFRMEDGKAVVTASLIPHDVESICKQTVKHCPASAIRIGEARGLMLVGNTDCNRSWKRFCVVQSFSQSMITSKHLCAEKQRMHA